MTRNSSRLHTLERSLKAPRKARPPARAMTVLRLEGGANATRLARLPKDMEDQIAIVRGRAVGNPSRGLLQLEARLLRNNEVETSAQEIQRHAHAAPPVTATAPIAQARALAASAPVTGNAFSGRFNVESFEDRSAALPRAPAAAPAVDYYPGSALPELQNTALAAVQSPALQSKRKRALSQDQQAVAANFERDVAAMLGSTPAPTAPEDRQWDDTLRNAAQTPPLQGAPAPIAAAPPQRDAHEVFNQMGLAMNYANRFDLGAMDLSARFDHFDNELALTPRASQQAPVPVQGLRLDDFDLMADLSEISGAQSASVSSVSVPTESTMDQNAAGSSLGGSGL
ncbi:MAG: hypothetical protein HY273_16260 [Gammaproteobacteria bacterium]|nr:hypothetical protein [Gammaproteobacteria bacterium]